MVGSPDGRMPIAMAGDGSITMIGTFPVYRDGRLCLTKAYLA